MEGIWSLEGELDLYSESSSYQLWHLRESNPLNLSLFIYKIGPIKYFIAEDSGELN